jgi:FSR family fosmidomycin resistance protein-like MFS transporter
MFARINRRMTRRAGVFVLVLLAIEFVDELAFGLDQAALPLIRDSLSLSYTEIGLLFTVPGLVAMVIEPLFGLIADGKHRRRLILGGGIAFIASLFAIAASADFLMLLFAFTLFYPGSGAFVSLSQAALMDVDPARHEQNMARWTFAGAVGVFAGPLLLGVIMGTTGEWRHAYIAVAGVAALIWIAASRFSFAKASAIEPQEEGARASLRDALRAVRNRNIIRWLLLLEFADLMMDILNSFLALYFVDVVGAGEGSAGIAVAVWAGVGLIGDLLLIPLLERVRGLTYLRISAALNFVLYPAFLLVPGFVPKLIIVALLGFTNAGWYSILQAQLYSALPGRSGLVMTINSVTGIVHDVLPLLIGAAAELFGLGSAMWLMLLGPIALTLGIPRRGGAPSEVEHPRSHVDARPADIHIHDAIPVGFDANLDDRRASHLDPLFADDAGDTSSRGD